MTKKLVWRQLKAPIVWRPQRLDEIEGVLVGRTLRDGMYGQYTVLAVRERLTTYLVSGTNVVQLVDSNQVEVGDHVRILFEGYKSYGDEGKRIKLFRMWVRE